MKVKQGSESSSTCHSQKALEIWPIWNVCMHSCPAELSLTNPLKWAQVLPESPPWSPICTIAAPFLLQGEKEWASTMSFFLFYLITLIEVAQDVCPQIWTHQITCRFDPTLGGFGGIAAVPKSSPDLTRPLLKCLHFHGKFLTIDGSKPSEKDTRLIQRLVKENSCKWALLWHFRFVWIL